jgi:hypothetical protein
LDHHKAEVRQVARRGASGEEAAQFLRELRQLRNGAGLGHAELAARAHYPHDSIRAAEVGPALPELPVLAAYVRGCGGTSEEWEERWRSVTKSPALPTLPTRAAGCSDAATAGARVGAVTPVPDVPDPAVIIAALDRVAGEMASPIETIPDSAGTITAAPAAVAAAGPAAAQPPWPVAKEPVAKETVPRQSVPAPQETVRTEPEAGTAQPAGAPSPGGRLPLPPRALVAALVAAAVCVLVAVLAMFA